jgi:hypothetical protein
VIGGSVTIRPVAGSMYCHGLYATEEAIPNGVNT